jgi:hypothetical protein
VGIGCTCLHTSFKRTISKITEATEVVSLFIKYHVLTIPWRVVVDGNGIILKTEDLSGSLLSPDFEGTMSEIFTKGINFSNDNFVDAVRW